MTKASKNTLEVSGLCKSYETFCIDNLNFDVPCGCITGFIGPNGAGKTSTIKMILNMAIGDAGSIKFFGQEKTVEHNVDIGVVMDMPLFNDCWTAHEIEKGLRRIYPHWDSLLFLEYLGTFKISPTKRVKELSRGMKIKLQIAAALSHQAKMLILDEPTSGLDPVARDEICDMLRDFVSDESKSLLFSTHITSDLEKIADNIVFILNGRIIFSGTKADLLNSYVHITGSAKEAEELPDGPIIGQRKESFGFEGLICASDVDKLPETIKRTKPSLDELIVLLNRGERS